MHCSRGETAWIPAFAGKTLPTRLCNSPAWRRIIAKQSYTQSEIGQIRAVIGSILSRSQSGSDEEHRQAEAAVVDGRCPPPLAPLWPLAAGNPGLFERLSLDPLPLTYSIYGFFPTAHEWVYGQDAPPSVTWEGRTRGLVALLNNGDAGLALKPMQSRREDEIAAIAADLEVGPRQHPTLPGFLTEDMAPGRFFTDLPTEQATPEFLHRIGRRLGMMLSALHRRGVCYNDATLSDPEGRSHLLVTGYGEAKLIDFGVSVLLDRHPDLAPEDVYNLLRTDPMFRVFRQMSPTPDDIRSLVGQYGRRLAAMSKDELLSRDLRFTEQGIRFAAERMAYAAPESPTPPGLTEEWLQRGFQEGYP